MSSAVTNGLNGRVKTIIEVDYNDFDKFIRMQYNVQDYEFAADQECSNDSDHRFVITEKRTLDTWDASLLEQFRSGDNPGMMTYILLQDLVNRDVIEPATYLIRVSW